MSVETVSLMRETAENVSEELLPAKSNRKSTKKPTPTLNKSAKKKEYEVHEKHSPGVLCRTGYAEPKIFMDNIFND